MADAGKCFLGVAQGYCNQAAARHSDNQENTLKGFSITSGTLEDHKGLATLYRVVAVYFGEFEQ